MPAPKRSNNPPTAKRRESLLSHWQAEILRNAIDETTLSQIRQRALRDAEVKSDPVLADMITSFLNQRAAELARMKAKEQRSERALFRRAGTTGQERGGIDHAAKDVMLSLEQMEGHFQEYLAHYDALQARRVLDRIEQLQQENPSLIARERVEGHINALEHMNQKRQKYHEQVVMLARRAVSASADGDHETAAQTFRRLSGIHASHPELLPDPEFEKIRAQLVKATEHHSHRLAARELVQRERAIADEIKRQASAIRRFHRVAHSVPHDHEAYRRAEDEYHRAVQEVKHHDSDWLAATILELADILAEWEHPPAKAGRQVDRFLDSVRSALRHLRKEIKTIERENR